MGCCGWERCQVWARTVSVMNWWNWSGCSNSGRCPEVSKMIRCLAGASSRSNHCWAGRAGRGPRGVLRPGRRARRGGWRRAEVDALQLRVEDGEDVEERRRKCGPAPSGCTPRRTGSRAAAAGAFGVVAVVVGIDLRCRWSASARSRACRCTAVGRLAVSCVDQAGVVGAAGPGEGVPVEDLVGLAGVDHLAGADVGAVQLRVLLDGEDPEDGAPGLAEEVDLVLAEPVAQVVGDLDGVADRLLEGQRRGGVEGGRRTCRCRAGPR